MDSLHRNALNKIALWLLPLCLFGSIILNIILMLLGVEQDSIFRRIFVYGGLFAASLLFYFCSEYKKARYVAVVVLFYYFIYFLKFLFFYDGNIILFLKSEYIELTLSFIFFGGIIFLYSNILKLYKIVTAYSAIVAAIALIYLIYSLIFAKNTTDFGWIDYLSTAALFTHFIVIMYINVSQKELVLRDKIIAGIIFGLLTAGIVRTQCRREVLSILILIIIALINMIIKPKQYLYIVLICIFFIVITLCIDSFSHNSRNFKEEIQDHKIATRLEPKIDLNKLSDNSKTDTEDSSISFIYKKKDLSYIREAMIWSQHVYNEIQLIKARHKKYENINHTGVLVDYVSKSRLVEKDYAKGAISTKEYLDLYDDYNFLNHTSLGGRLYLYCNALFEFSKSPVAGNGLFYFSKKYGVEAHCIPLELMCDFGILGILFIIFYLYICGEYFIKSYIKKSENNEFIDFIIIYTICTFPQDIFAGSLYSYVTLVKYVLCPVLCIAHKNFYDKALSDG